MLVYCDIDGTLTLSPHKAFGDPNHKAIAALKKLIASGEKVVVWSGRGEDYAIEFTKKYDIKPYAVLGKPRYCIDDCPTIRPTGRMQVITSEQFIRQMDV